MKRLFILIPVIILLTGCGNPEGVAKRKEAVNILDSLWTKAFVDDSLVNDLLIYSEGKGATEINVAVYEGDSWPEDKRAAQLIVDMIEQDTSGLLKAMKDLGFKRVVASDFMGEYWKWDLKKL